MTVPSPPRWQAPQAINRVEWTALPHKIRIAIEDQLGSPVVAAKTQHGGFSPGAATIVHCADNSDYFVKAVNPDLNPLSPQLYRDEALFSAALPKGMPVPRLRHVYDDGDWIALVFDAIHGRMPELPWAAADVQRLMATIQTLGTTPLAGDLTRLPSVPDRLAHSFGAYRRLAKTPQSLTAWERGNIDRLVVAAESALEPMAGDSLVHLDLRADNIVLAHDGSPYIVDWSWASSGAPWLDKVCFLVNVATYRGDAERFLRDDQLLASVPSDHVTAFLIGLCGMWTEAVAAPAPPGLPALRAFQRLERDATLAWIRSRTAWG
ncbi:phosphotransferase [Streptomyces scabiei]|uniref:phosphotransferase n=1 Tax=Streptomyces scabiei TaxID=1930 RepID=UPI0007C74718|nr:phosphotransferase [Streptomyces scabiei]MDX3147248.1 phosphotransferase [Streptomyces scabiei]MDX3162315.1 phosphotransferase [Streptomyces scabiei]MDX3252783.1 phosphotransferase [Streptomyces scabiei]MDX3288349.1 phosphotransferase [Streptomyces scabiei]MDX3444628.1 phosphotransferase [Streptomyces scabiei]